MKEEKVQEQRMMFDAARETEARQAALVQSLRQKVLEYENTLGNVEGAASRTELTISTLQHDNQRSQERIVELESRVRSALYDYLPTRSQWCDRVEVRRVHDPLPPDPSQKLSF